MTRRTQLSLRDLPWHPALFAATIVMAFWLDSVVSPYAAFRPLAVAVTGATLMTLIAWVVTRSAAWAGIAATAVLGMLYSKHLVSFLVHLYGVAGAWGFALWMTLIGVAVVLLCRIAWRSRGGWTATRTNRILNVAAAAYVGSTLVLALTSGKLAYAIGELRQGAPLEVTTVSAASGGEAGRPDMYLILVDGYPRADVLHEAMHIDNSDFTAALAERGFTIATRSRSNYLWTRQSLTSMLHMEYVHNIPEFRAVLENQVPPEPTLRELVNDNPAFELARRHGYQVVSMGYPFEQTALRQADVFVDDSGFMNEFELTLLVSTYLGDVLAVLAPDLASSHHRGWVEHQLDVLVEIAAADPGVPRIVFGHIPAPHQPAVFGRDGEPIAVPISATFYADSPQERGEPRDEFVRRYRDQLEYLNGRIIDTIDGILSAADGPPVIVLWSDHGSSSRIDWTATSPDDAPANLLRERTAVLFASLTPGRTDVFPDDITPASIFRYLSDAYFGTELGRALPPEVDE